MAKIGQLKRELADGWHPAANLFPLMSSKEIEELAEDIRANGLCETIKTLDGKVVDGRNRQIACSVAGVEVEFEEYDRKFFGSDYLSYVVSLNLHRRHMDTSQRAMVATKLAELKKGRPEGSAGKPAITQEDAAAMLNVSRDSVQQARKVAEDGAPELVEAVERGDVAVTPAAEITALPKKEQAAAVKGGKEGVKKAQKKVQALVSSKDVEWYTPEQYLESARELMGNIDLDPASCAEANKTVKAVRYFSQEENGLNQEWSGCVWCNPPYGRDEDNASNQGKWTYKAREEYKRGAVDSCLVLVNAVTERSWFGPLWKHPICFVDHRIKFVSPHGKKNSPTHANVIVYLGTDVDRFVEIFSAHGQCVVPDALANVAVQTE